MPQSSVRRRPTSAAALLCLLLAGAAACSDDPAKPTGPVSIRFITLPYYTHPVPAAADTARATAIVSMDGGPGITVRTGDSVTNVPRGEHTFAVRYDIDYLVSEFTVNIDPNGPTENLFLPQAATCRYFPADFDETGRTNFCTPGVKKNLLDFKGTTENLLCAANDYGEFCSTLPDENQLGGTWPSTGINQYLAHAKLLVAATVPAGTGSRSLAMSLYNAGDYAPRSRLLPTGSDSTRYRNEVWTDARHVPFYYSSTESPRTPLGFGDRENANFGLSVTNTYYFVPTIPDAIFVRFDVKNISNEADYRRVNPEVPAAGQTITDVYLAPFVDATLGIQHSSTPGEPSDDNATVFPEDNLIAAYDQAFAVTIPTNTGTTVNTSPGLVGFQYISGPTGFTPRAVLLDRGDSLSFFTPAREEATHRLLAAGRAGDQTGCTLRAAGAAYVCSPESPNDVLAGWSIGPIPSLAPGQSVSLTVAAFIAAPVTGTFTSGGGIGPENDKIGDNTRAIAQVAGNLRTRAQATKNVTVP